MNMDLLTKYVDPKLLETLLTISKADLVIQKILSKFDDETTLINSLIAGLLCIISRESATQIELTKFIQANPEINEQINKMRIENENHNKISIGK